MDFDLREYKNQLRSRAKELRRGLSVREKKAMDTAVLKRIISSPAYRQCRTLLTYVSTDIEVDTRALIEYAVSDGKRVAVPKCIPNSVLMDFFYIKSINELSPGTFSVPEPADGGSPLKNFKGALCIVPGLVFDMKGFRLGYGKGYYDRFLAAHPHMRLMGLCYCKCTVQSLVSGRFDRPVDLLATEKYIKTFTEGAL